MLPQLVTLIMQSSIKSKMYIISNIYRPHAGCLELFLKTMKDILCEVSAKYKIFKVFMLGHYIMNLITNNIYFIHL